MSERKPLILLSNDDGINSPGLRAAVQAVAGLGEIMIIAPQEQQSSMGSSLPGGRRITIASLSLTIDGIEYPAYSISGSPAQSVLYGMLWAVRRQPDLVVSGINFGENLGTSVFVSGTVGAAIKAADLGVKALAVSLEAPKSMHHVPSFDEMEHALNWTAAQRITRLMAERALAGALPGNVEILKIDVPTEATIETPWRLTTQSRQSYYAAIQPPDNSSLERPFIDYMVNVSREAVEPTSDIQAFLYDRVISVTPLALDMTARADLERVDAALRATKRNSRP